MDLSSDLKKAKRGAIAKAISIIENDEKESRKLIKKIFKTSGKSTVIGITGPAGAGRWRAGRESRPGSPERHNRSRRSSRR